jgi:hypothetical protein
MSAPKGNQFWKLRSKHGRDKLFASPELLWEASCEYFQSVDDNPFYESKAMAVSGGFGQGSSIEMAELPVKRPYTLHALCQYLNCNTAYFRQFKAALKENANDFSTVICDIEEVVYNHKFEGAASGFFNANIIARDLGLKEQSEVAVSDNRKTVDDMFPPEEELKD